MLVLSRKVGESIIIGPDKVVVTILEFGHGKVRLGIEAPASIPVHRQEVWDRLHEGEEAQPEAEKVENG